MKRLIYLVGEPGVGKSTLLAAALKGWDRLPQKKPLAHDLLHRDGLVEGAELGVRRPHFPGTDALAMDAINAAERLLAEPPAPIIVGEGARLGNVRFLTSARNLGYDVSLVHVVSPHAAEQRAARAAGMGTYEQKDSWVRAQATKALNLVEKVPAGVRVAKIDTSKSGAAETLRDVIALPVRRARRAVAA